MSQFKKKIIYSTFYRILIWSRSEKVRIHTIAHNHVQNCTVPQIVETHLELGWDYRLYIAALLAPTAAISCIRSV